MKGFNYKKSTQALNLFSLKEGGKINKMKAIKLMWLADRLHLRQYGRTITGDTYFALKLGPVASNAKDIIEGNPFLSAEESDYRTQFLKATDWYNFESIKQSETKVFSKTDIETIDKVYSAFGNKNHFDLSEFSHHFPEWKRFENALKANSSSRYEMQFLDFFNSDESNSNFFDEDAEDLELIKTLFFRIEKVLAD